MSNWRTWPHHWLEDDKLLSSYGWSWIFAIILLLLHFQSQYPITNKCYGAPNSYHDFFINKVHCNFLDIIWLVFFNPFCETLDYDYKVFGTWLFCSYWEWTKEVDGPNFKNPNLDWSTSKEYHLSIMVGTSFDKYHIVLSSFNNL